MAPENICNIWRTRKPVCIIYVAAFLNPARGFYMVLSKRFSPIQADSFRKGKHGFYFTWWCYWAVRNPAHVCVTLSHTTCSTNWLFPLQFKDFPLLPKRSHYDSEAVWKPRIPPVHSTNRACLCLTLLMSSLFTENVFFPDRVGIFILSSLVCPFLIEDVLDRFNEDHIE